MEGISPQLPKYIYQTGLIVVAILLCVRIKDSAATPDMKLMIYSGIFYFGVMVGFRKLKWQAASLFLEGDPEEDSGTGQEHQNLH